MTAQALGSAFQFFTGEIRDVQDPDKQGKMRIHIHGHTNQQNPPVPDSDLHWAHSVMNNSPSQNGIGKTSHYLPGSTIIGFFLDPLTKQIPIILGSMHKAGVTQGSAGGIEPNNIDGTHRSPPGGPKGQALDPSVLANVVKTTVQQLLAKTDFNWGVSQIGNQQNLGAQGSQNNAQKLAVAQKQQNNPSFLSPTNPTLAAAAKNTVLQALKSIDPGNKSGAVPQSLDPMIVLNQIAGLTSPGGVASMVSGALSSALQSAASSHGLSSMLGAVSAIASGMTNPSAIGVLNEAVAGALSGTTTGALAPAQVVATQTLANLISSTTSSIGGIAPGSLAAMIASAPPGGTFTTTVNTANGAVVQHTVTVSQNVTGTQLGTGTPIPSFTGTEAMSIATTAASTLTSTISSAITSGNLSSLAGTVESTLASVAQQGISSVLGGVNPANILGSISTLIPNISGNIQSTITNVVKTLNNATNITNLQQQASTALGINMVAYNLAHMFSPAGAASTAGVASSLAGAIESAAAGTIASVTTPMATIASQVISSATPKTGT